MKNVLPISTALFTAHMRNPTAYKLRFFQRHNGSRPEFRRGYIGQDCLCQRFVRNRKYPLRAKRITTRIGPAVVLTIRDSLEDPAQVFQPKRYSDVVTDDDIDKINTNAVSLNLFYRGACATAKANLLVIDVMHICFHFITGTPCRHETMLNLFYRGACATAKAFLLVIDVMHICFHCITGTPCRREITRQGF